MTKVQARGIKLDTDGLGLTLRVNGVIATAPVVNLDVNDGYKTVATSAPVLTVHPTGGYTDVHYTLAEEVLGIDIAYATGITNAPTFEDVLVANSRDGGNKGADYDYIIQVGSDGTEFGYSASDFGHIFKNVNGVKLTELNVTGLDGAIVVAFEDGERPAKAITVAFEGLIVPDLDLTDGEALTIRLEWSDANSQYEVATTASLIAVGTYLTDAEGATMGVTIAQIN